MKSEKLIEMILQEGFSVPRILDLAYSSAGRELKDHGFSAAAMAALPYPAGGVPDLSTSGSPHVRIAPFARANYYQEAVNRLKRVVRRLGERTGRPKREFRIFVNSPLPEKSLALEAGIGFQGRNSLIITGETGSLTVLAGLALPFLPEEAASENRDDLGTAAETAPPGSGCGSCRACVDACPAGAITFPGGVDTSRCLQALSTRPFPEEFWPLWENRLYGCQICQEVCPKNRNIPVPAPLSAGEKGRLGPSLDMRTLLSKGERLKEDMKGSVLAQKWITPEHLLRNTLIAAGNHPDGKAVAEEVKHHINHPDPAVAAAAAWAAGRLD